MARKDGHSIPNLCRSSRVLRRREAQNRVTIPGWISLIRLGWEKIHPSTQETSPKDYWRSKMESGLFYVYRTRWDSIRNGWTEGSTTRMPDGRAGACGLQLA